MFNRSLGTFPANSSDLENISGFVNIFVLVSDSKKCFYPVPLISLGLARSGFLHFTSLLNENCRSWSMELNFP